MDPALQAMQRMIDKVDNEIKVQQQQQQQWSNNKKSKKNEHKVKTKKASYLPIKFADHIA